MARKRVIRTNRHHRLSRSRSGGIPFGGEINGVPNVKLVNYKQHQAFHKLFPDTHPHAIVRELNDNWIDPNYVVIAVLRSELKQLKHLRL
jgi:hypothetical protein